MSDYSATYLLDARTDRTGPVAERDSLRLGFERRLPDAGVAAASVLDELVTLGEPGLLHSGAPTFLGFVMGGAYPVAVATEWLTSLWDQCGALYATSPTASVVEEVVAQWLIELFGLASDTSVGVTTGCAMANLTGLAAARHSVLADRGWDVERRGLFGAPEPRILVSAGCHATVFRAIRLLGMAGQIRVVDTDNQGRMSLHALDRELVASSGPLIVCGQVGNVDTGAVDPVDAICDAARAREGWVHLDAAFGMWAAAGPSVRHQVAGLARADSWATDAHKWLNVPYDCGIVLCARPDAHRAAMRTSAEYLTPATGGSRDPVDFTPDMSRRARSLVLWATLRHLGAAGVADLIDRSCAFARAMAADLARVDGIEILNDVVLNQVLLTFRAREGVSESEHLERVVDALHRGETAWASPTRWRGRAALRLSVCNWQTTAEDVERAVAAVTAAHLLSDVRQTV
ncbi:pyridoxal phosphate-dependent decarboxylase family protein [Rhodococcus sp. 27YEA15]|uniref:pyridoxal phosphate-dependent decarboxylase family protein n=1 Tax=Rhodococcus sp. 27YEA15 TaxID=3156259 RepID=UPI003C7C0353